MTLIEAQVVAEGIVERIKEEFDQQILAQRALTMYIGNSFQKSPKDFDKVFPMSSEKPGSNKKKKWTLPVEELNKMLKDFILK